ncbi:MAG: HAMP domain-containing sensor histidine kinase [Pseudomonadota bacterium]
MRQGKKKYIVLFLLAAVFPVTVISYFGFSTLSARRDIVHRLIQANLGITAERIMERIEGGVHVLVTADINALMSSLSQNAPSKKQESHTGRKNYSNKSLFILNREMEILWPAPTFSSSEGDPTLSLLDDSAEIKDYRKAQDFEFQKKDFESAAELYHNCMNTSPTHLMVALSLEGFARSLMKWGKLERAFQSYQKLAHEYDIEYGPSGHPYGISARLMSGRIAMRLGRIDQGLAEFMELFHHMNEGRWRIRRPIYDHYIALLLESINSLASEKHQGQIDTLTAQLQSHQSSYYTHLVFLDLLERIILPQIKLRQAGREKNPDQNIRFMPILSETAQGLVAFISLGEEMAPRTIIGQFISTEILHRIIFPELMATLENEYDVVIKLIEDNTGQPGDIDHAGSEEKRVISFRQLPLSAKLQVSLPPAAGIHKTLDIEILVYAIVLLTIIGLMVFGIVMIVRDVRRNEEMVRLKTDFFNNITHELKTPLSLIHLYTETLMDQKNISHKTAADCYRIIMKESERLTHFINTILDFSLIELNRKEFRFKEEDIVQITQEAVDSYSYFLKKKGFRIETSFPKKTIRVSIDKDALVGVFYNLLNNSIKYSKERKEARISLREHKESLILEFADRGIGIPTADQKIIFERYARSRNAAKSSAPGAGLGLPLAKKVIEAHGGEILVSSRKDGGSVFTLTIPMGNKEKDLI